MGNSSVSLFWMEKGGERDCLLHLVKIHTQPCITDLCSGCWGSLAGLSYIPLTCCETSSSGYLFLPLSLVNSKMGKGAAWDKTDTVLLMANKDLVTSIRKYSITNKSYSCINLVKLWFYEGKEINAFFFFFWAVTALSCGLWTGQDQAPQRRMDGSALQGSARCPIVPALLAFPSLP